MPPKPVAKNESEPEPELEPEPEAEKARSLTPDMKLKEVDIEDLVKADAAPKTARAKWQNELHCIVRRS